ncbi:MAG TPA: endonuclease/exonuclease/phosphatase family protein [Burkholderiales bacterium]
MPFTLLTCNILADSYIRREWYPLTPDEWLRPEVRHPALAAHLAASGADILCVQEVEEPVFDLLQAHLGAAGYRGTRAAKSLNKPDGCATFWHERFTLEAEKRFPYPDGEPGRAASGHVAQILTLRDGAKRLGVANTHLKWDAPKTPLEEQYGLGQIRQLITALAARKPHADGWILCGDFNVTPDAPVIAALTEAGYRHAHGAYPQACTAAPNHAPRVIDYLFHSKGLNAEPVIPPPITSETPLPGPGFPSDHLALAARFDWRH